MRDKELLKGWNFELQSSPTGKLIGTYLCTVLEGEEIIGRRQTAQGRRVIRPLISKDHYLLLLVLKDDWKFTRKRDPLIEGAAAKAKKKNEMKWIDFTDDWYSVDRWFKDVSQRRIEDDTSEDDEGMEIQTESRADSRNKHDAAS